MPVLTVLVGFPASGKSRMADSRKHANPDLQVYHDPFKLNFFVAEGFKGIIRSLDNGLDCVVCDVNFCHTSNKTFFDRIIAGAIPGLAPQYEYFQKEEVNCRANIEGDFAASAQDEAAARRRSARLEALELTKAHYAIPPDVIVHAVPNYYAAGATTPPQTATPRRPKML